MDRDGEELKEIVLELLDDVDEALKPSNILNAKDLNPDSPLAIPQNLLQQMWESWSAAHEAHRDLLLNLERSNQAKGGDCNG